LIDAATTNDESQRKQRLSTVLLLADHPGVGLGSFLNDGMSCCNIGVGLAALVLFNPLFAPRPSGRYSNWLQPDADLVRAYDTNLEVRFERDVMADRQSLGEALKQMWKVLIFYDMVFCEANRPINWERASLDAIAELFRGKAGVDRLAGQG
jgi:hypothetical protein